MSRPIETAEYRRGFRAGYLRALEEVEKARGYDPVLGGPDPVVARLRHQMRKDADSPAKTE